MKSGSSWYRFGIQLAAVVLALVIYYDHSYLAANGQPIEAYKNIIIGSFGSVEFCYKCYCCLDTITAGFNGSIGNIYGWSVEYWH